MDNQQRGELTFASSLLAQSLAGAFLWVATFVILVGAGTAGAGVVIGSGVAIGVGIGTAVLGIALRVLAGWLRVRHSEAVRRYEGS